MLNLKFWQRFSGPNSAVALLVAGAVGAAFFTVSAGMAVYVNTRNLISSSEWVQHTDEVLSNLQRANLATERIDYRLRLFLLTGDEDQLDRARNNGNYLGTTVIRIQTLVTDNAQQTAYARDLAACSAQLGASVTGFTAKSAIPEVQIKSCQKTLTLMTEDEQVKLQERTKGSQQNSLRSIGAEIAFVVSSLITVVVLFGFLLRDLLLRQRFGRQTTMANERLARTVNELEDRAHESELLTSARDELQLCLQVDQVYESAALSFSRLLTGTNGSLCMINNSRQLVEVVSAWGVSAVVDFHSPESCCGLRSGQPRWRQPGVSEIHCTHFGGEPAERYLCMPIIAHGNTLGVLYVGCPTVGTVKAVELRMDGLRQLVQLTGMAIATLNLRTKLENQSIRDPLTGLFNRHFMQISLDREVARASRRKQLLAVFMLDLDHFKRFNDTYGHAAGDTVLKAISEIFRSSVRTEDVACRYGGEEFTIILPDVTAEVAYDRAQAIRRAIASLRLPLDLDAYPEFTISIGVAFFPDDGETGDLLLRRADQALYRAKRSGRNQVALFERAPATI